MNKQINDIISNITKKKYEIIEAFLLMGYYVIERNETSLNTIEIEYGDNKNPKAFVTLKFDGRTFNIKTNPDIIECANKLIDKAEEEFSLKLPRI
jgi:hypothetical protein